MSHDNSSEPFLFSIFQNIKQIKGTEDDSPIFFHIYKKRYHN